jgi:hypothetical protein
MSKALRTGCMAGLVLLAMLVIPLLSLAQSTRGELAGNVADPSGAVIVGAQISAVGVDTGVKSPLAATTSRSPRPASALRSARECSSPSTRRQHSTSS